MPQSQKGFAQIIVLLFLIFSIAVGVVLVQKGTTFFSKAAQEKKSSGQTCATNNQCATGLFCQKSSCDPTPDCQKNPNKAVCKLAQRLCSKGTCSVDPNFKNNQASEFEVGLEAGAQFDTSRVNTVAETGAKWVRLNFIGKDWSNPNSNDVKKYSQIIEGYKSMGINVIGLIGAESVDGGYDRNNPASFTPKFTAAAKGIVDRFGDKVKVYEIFNEPNDWAGGSSSVVAPRYFAEYLQEIYKQLKVRDKRDIQLLSGPLLSMDLTTASDYLEQTFEEGKKLDWENVKSQSGSYPLDGISYHIYVAQGEQDKSKVESKIQENLKAIESVIDNNDKGKKIWISEFGWGTRKGAVSEDTQAQNLEKAYAIFKQHPSVKMAMWFTLQDFNDEEWGLIRADGRKKKAWDSFIKAAKSPRCESEFKYPECDWSSKQVRDVYQNSCTGAFEFKNLHYQDGACGYKAPASPSPSPSPTSSACKADGAKCVSDNECCGGDCYAGGGYFCRKAN